MPFRILRLRKQIRDIKKGIHDPGHLAVKQILATVRWYLIALALISFSVIGLLFFLGWTEVITQPTLIARIIFWILFFPIALFWIITYGVLWKTKKAVKKSIKNIKQETIHVQAEIKGTKEIDIS